MSSDLPNLPKYKLAKRTDSEVPPERQEPADETAKEIKKRPLELRQTNSYTPADDSMLKTYEMLDDAYGAETRARKRSERMTTLNRILIGAVVVFLFFASTLAYAHTYKGWLTLEPRSWYLPFLLSAALSSWFCLKSIKFWKDRSRSLTLVGLFMASLTVYWNVYILEYATKGESIKPSNAIWAPKDVPDLLTTVEINALRGVSKTKTAYTQLSPQQYHKFFNSISRQEWRPIFQAFLSPEEFKQVNLLNIQDNMYLVAERINQTRVDTWDAMQEKVEQGEFKLRIQQTLIKPYVWLLSYLPR